METNKKTVKGKGWAKVPHGIVDAAIPDVMKLLLWYCYDKYPKWRYNVTDVARSLDKTPQCIRKHFRTLLEAGVLRKTGEMETKGGILRLFSFHPDQVDAFVKSQLMVNPETDPESDPETDVETNPETNPETGVSHTNTHLPKLPTENHITEKKGTENNRTKRDEGLELAEAFERLFPYNALQGSQSNPTSEGKKEEIQENGSQPPSPSVAPRGLQGSKQCPFQSPIPLSKQRFSIL
jgi:hypothetical protein